MLTLVFPGVGMGAGEAGTPAAFGDPVRKRLGIHDSAVLNVNPPTGLSGS